MEKHIVHTLRLMVDEIMPTGMNITFWLPEGKLPGGKPFIGRVTREDRLSALADFIEHCQANGIKTTQKNYKGLQRISGWPSDAHFGEGLGWRAWVTAADDWRHEQEAILADVQTPVWPTLADEQARAEKQEQEDAEWLNQDDDGVEDELPF